MNHFYFDPIILLWHFTLTPSLMMPDLDRVDRVLGMPLQQGRAYAHVGRELVAPGIGTGDQVPVIGQNQVGLIGARVAMLTAFIAHIHVHHGPGHVTFAMTPDLPPALRKLTAGPVVVAGVSAALSTAAIVRFGNLFRAPGIAILIGFVGAGEVVIAIGQEQVVRIGERVVQADVIVRKSIGARPWTGARC